MARDCASHKCCQGPTVFPYQASLVRFTRIFARVSLTNLRDMSGIKSS